MLTNDRRLGLKKQQQQQQQQQQHLRQVYCTRVEGASCLLGLLMLTTPNWQNVTDFFFKTYNVPASKYIVQLTC